jgi:hypothetical protein
MFRVALYFVFLFVVFQLASCSLVQPSVSSDGIRETPRPTPEKSPKSIAEENFEKNWKSKYDATLAEIESNRRLWQENKIANYDFICQQIAGGENGWSAVVIKVQDSKTISIERTPKDGVAKIDGYEKFDTIDKIFDYLKKELENGRIITAKYNEKYGYPEEFNIGYSNDIDSWFGANIEKFEIVK